MEPLPSYHFDHMFRQPYHMHNYGYPPQPPNHFIDFRSVETDFLNVSDGMSPGRSCRGLEVRKEKSRDAARSRRGKENYEFYELAKLLPLPAAITSQLDKASIIRLCISYLSLRDFSRKGHPIWIHDEDKNDKDDSFLGLNKLVSSMSYDNHQGSHILHSLDGFAFILSVDGRFLYISETVSIYLGLSQVEVIGCCLFDYIHRNDHLEVSKQLSLPVPIYGSGASDGMSPGSGSDDASPRPISPIHDRIGSMKPEPGTGLIRSFCVRMKSTLTKRGMHTKSTGYRVVQMITYFRHQHISSHPRKHGPALIGLVGLAIALPPPTITEWRLEQDMFVMRLSKELRILYCEEKICQLMDVCADDITGTILYDHCHPGDIHKLSKAHSDLLSKGQVLTEYYRLMNKHGGYVWVQTCATTIINKNPDDSSTIAVNYILSGVEHSGCIMSSEQMARVSGDSADGGTVTPGHNCPTSSSTHGQSPQNQTNDAGSSPVSYTAPCNINNKHDEDDIVVNNARRKMEKPRKRKREDFAPIASSKNTKDSVHNDAPMIGSVGHRGDTEPVLLDASVTLPTDLSLKSSGRVSDRLRVAQDSVSGKCDVSPSLSSLLPEPAKQHDSASFSSATTRFAPIKTSGTFELDKQNEKHLDEQFASSTHWSDFNNFDNSLLPASYFLRSLYTNRETVIRSNINGANSLLYPTYTGGMLPSTQAPLAYGKTPSSSPLLAYGKNPISQTPLVTSVKPYTLTSHHTNLGSHDLYTITPPLSASPVDKTSHDILDQSAVSKQAWCSINVPANFSVHYDRNSSVDDTMNSLVPYCANIPAIKHNTSAFPTHNLWYHSQ